MPVIDGIVETAAGVPVAGARIMLESAPAPAADVALLTGSNGCFTIGAVRPGIYVIRAATDRHGSARASVTVEDKTPRQRLVIRLPD